MWWSLMLLPELATYFRKQKVFKNIYLAPVETNLYNSGAGWIQAANDLGDQSP